MSFLTKTTAPVVFIATDVLVTSKRLIKRRIKHIRDEIRKSDDANYIKSKRESIAHLRKVVRDLNEIIINGL